MEPVGPAGDYRTPQALKNSLLIAARTPHSLRPASAIMEMDLPPPDAGKRGKKSMRGLLSRGCIVAMVWLSVFGANGARAADPVGDETFEGTFNCLKPAGGTDTAPILCQSQINPGLPSFDFALVWHDDKSSGTRVLDRIEIRRSGDAAPFETLTGIVSSLPPAIANEGFEVLDLNFDGFLDLRVMRAAPVGDSKFYQNWLWSNEEGKFVATPGLDAIVSPKFDADDQEIVSHVTKGDTGTTDIYAYDGMTPGLIHREVDKTGAAGCQRTFYDRVEDELRKTGTGACKDE
jgi:hypothetical protein